MPRRRIVVAVAALVHHRVPSAHALCTDRGHWQLRHTTRQEQPFSCTTGVLRSGQVDVHQVRKCCEVEHPRCQMHTVGRSTNSSCDHDSGVESHNAARSVFRDSNEPDQ